MQMEVDKSLDVGSSSREDHSTKFPSTSIPTDNPLGPLLPTYLPKCANELCNQTVWYLHDAALPEKMKIFQFCSPLCRNRCLKHSTELMKVEISKMETKLSSMKTSLKGFTCLNKAEKPKVQEKPKTSPQKSKPSVTAPVGRGHLATPTS